MKNSKWLLLAGLVIMMMTVGCEKQMGFIAPEGGDVDAAATSTLPIQYNPGGSWFTYFNYMPPVAAPGVDYLMSIGNDGGDNGSVRVWNDATNLYVEYHTLNGWKISQVHVAVALDLDGIPHNNSGNMTPGKFPYPPKTEFNVVPPSDVHLVTIPWDTDWDSPPDPGLFMVTHCIVFWVDPVSGDTTWQTGTGADTTKLYKDVKLPEGCVDLSGVFPPPAENWPAQLRVTLWGIGPYPSGYNVWDDDNWRGWCAEPGVPFNQNDPYSVCLYSSQDPNILLDDRLDGNGHWDEINWLLNHKGDYPGATVEDFKRVFHLLLGFSGPTLGPIAQQMYADALLNDGYRVPPGGWVAVLVVVCGENPEGTQLTFIEVDP